MHNEAYDGWKSGGYPTYSLLSQRYLSRTVTCSSYLRDWLIDRGHSRPGSIGVVKLGIEVSDFSPVDKAARAKAKKDLLNLDPKTVVISVVGRLDPQKRPVLVPDIADQLRKLGDYKPGSFVIVMLGDGDLKDRVKARVAEMKVNSFVRLVGTVGRPQDYLAATDVFLLPSMSEGISIAVAEAMAMSLPIVTARAGALPEQLGYEEGDPSLIAGVLIDHKLDAAHDAPLYAKELHALVSHPELRDSYGQNGRRNVEATFNWRDTLEGMFAEVEKARLPDPKKARHMPNPAAHYAIQNLLVEAHDVQSFCLFPPIRLFQMLTLVAHAHLAGNRFLGCPNRTQGACAFRSRSSLARPMRRVECSAHAVDRRARATPSMRRLGHQDAARQQRFAAQRQIPVRCLVSPRGRLFLRPGRANC